MHSTSRCLFRFFCGLFAFSLVGIAIAGYALYTWAVADLPPIMKMSDYQPPHAATILARDGSQIGILHTEKRFFIPLSEMSPYLPKALMAVEDSDFYAHQGVDPMAIARAFVVNLRKGKHSQGGSTITQQVIKRLLLTPERSYERKLKEAILAYRLEKHLSKDDILTIYLNHSFLGSNAYGVEAAARTYFAKHAKELTLAQSALIAGLPQAPSAYNPYRHPKEARLRQLHVLNRMKELSWISESEYQAAVNEPLVYKSMSESMGMAGSWYLEEVRRQLLDLFSERNARKLGLNLPLYGEQAVYELGLTVHTAMEPAAQIAADKALRTGLEAADKRHGWRGPVERIKAEDMAKTIAAMAVNPADFANGNQVRGVVTQVNGSLVTVKMGIYTGRINLSKQTWAHKLPGSQRLLNVGDVIYVSAEGLVGSPSPAKGKPANEKQGKGKTRDKGNPQDSVEAFNPEHLKPSSLIALRLQQRPEVQGALVSMEARTGDVIAIAGGYSFADSQFNRATQAHRQPGSSFKPIVYSAALDSGFTPMSILMDTPIVIVDRWTGAMWRPGNFEKNFRGPLPLRTALMLSRNLCTIRVAQKIGVSAIIDRAHELGIEADFPKVLNICLGSVEVTPVNMAEAYSAFADGGMRAKARFITKVLDRDGKIIYEAKPVKTRAISPQNACLMSYLLQQVVEGGTGTRAKMEGRAIGGKTGTTNEERDAWFMGITPQLVTSVYIGYDVSRPMGRGETGSKAAAPIFASYAHDVLPAYPAESFAVPEEGIEQLRVDKYSGSLLGIGPGSGGILVPFYTGTRPGTGRSADHESGEDSGGGNDQSLPELRDDLLKDLF